MVPIMTILFGKSSCMIAQRKILIKG